MGAFYEPATEDLLRTAERVRSLWHEERLAGADIGFVFRIEPPKRDGQVVLAQVTKVPALMATETDLDYIVWVARDEWDGLDEARRMALIDHELCHCVAGKSGGWSTRGHEVNEFVQVIERHGLWSRTLARVGEALQEELPAFKQMREALARGDGRIVAASVTAAVEAALAAELEKGNGS